ncbi:MULTISPECIES: TVP38/TMEM64 family protein [unclassified Sulfurospirillum]|uniref:TVP38/TMEM64 family protein n=1 Tax=unclassified Sulfurospirillum TaxID=2618290 RepID=UPI000500AC92|nr:MULTISPECIES: TVP38/TMEM64 family protein [unclassified Sulfurospirillum]KFL34907.1 membrane protein [Sulfurospirillum sp. SCADC]
MLKPSKIAILLLSGVALTLFFICPQTRHFFFELIALFQSLDIETIKAYILSFGMLAPLVSFALMVFQAVLAPLPAFLITFANAALFGWVYGAALSWFSAMVGALLCFYIAKFLGRDVVEKLTSKMALESVDAFFEKHGTYAIVIARLLPFISFDVVSYAAGLTSMRLSSFLIATGMGQLPATLVYSYAGEMLTGGAKTVVYGLLILFAVSILVYLIKRVYRAK